MMSDRANAWVSGDHAFVFAGSRNTGGPLFYQVDLRTGHVVSVGPMVPYAGETEFWHWTPDGAIILGEGPRLHRVNPFAPTDDVVLDISGVFPGCTVDQWHASDDGSTYSATVKNASYQKIAMVTSRHGRIEPWRVDGEFDECQCSRSGRHVVIKINRGRGDDNWIINLDTYEETWLLDLERAIQHSDCGPDYVVGEADKPDPGGCVRWQLNRLGEGPRFLFPSLNVGYVSTRAGRCLWSNDTHLSLVDLATGAVTWSLPHGADVRPTEPGYYDRRPKANLSPCGRVATYMVDGSVSLVVLP